MVANALRPCFLCGNNCAHFCIVCIDMFLILVSWNCETENALAHQASVLQSDLEKSMKDNAMLFSKIGSIISFFPCKLDNCFSTLWLLIFI